MIAIWMLYNNDNDNDVWHSTLATTRNQNLTEDNYDNSDCILTKAKKQIRGGKSASEIVQLLLHTRELPVGR